MREVKHYESGMVVNPVTIHPDTTLADARALMRPTHSGIPVVERNSRQTGEAVWNSYQPRCALRDRPGSLSTS